MLLQPLLQDLAHDVFSHMHAFFPDRAQFFITSVFQEHGSTATLYGLTPSVACLLL